MPGFRLEERAVDGIGRSAAVAMGSGRGRAQSPSPMPTSMCILLVTKTDAITLAPLAGVSFRAFDWGDPRDIIASPTTRSNGSARTSLPVGPTYCLEETAVAQGYPLAHRYTRAHRVPLNGNPTATVSVPDPRPLTPTPPDGKARA
jgi:hypothetical protein